MRKGSLVLVLLSSLLFYCGCTPSSKKEEAPPEPQKQKTVEQPPPKTEGKTEPKAEPIDIDGEITDITRDDYRLCEPSEFAPQREINFFQLKKLLVEKKIVSKTELAQFIERAIRADENKSYEAERGWNYLLAYNSKSLQHASGEKPRLVLFSDRKAPGAGFPNPPGGTGSVIDFIAAFSAFDEDNYVELLEFNYKHNRFCSRLIKIKDDQLSFNAHPSSCVRCHTTNVRPNWEPYPLWPRFFDSTNGNLEEDKDVEHKLYVSFMNKKHTDDIYSAISDEEGMIRIPNNRFGKHGRIDGRKTVTSRNGSFSDSVQKINFLRIAKMLTETRDHASYRYAYLAAMANCSNIESFLPAQIATQHKMPFDQIEKNTKKAIQDAYQERIREIRTLTTFAHPIGNNEDETRQIGVIAKLRYLLENRPNPISMADWSMSFLYDAYGFFSNQITIHHLSVAYSHLAFSDEPHILDLVAKLQNQAIVSVESPELCSVLHEKSLNSLKTLVSSL